MSTKCACQSKHGNCTECNFKCNVLNCSSDSLCTNIYQDLLSTTRVLPKGVFVVPDFDQSYREPPSITLLNDSYGINADSEELTPLHPTPSPPAINFYETTFYGSTKLNYSHCPPKNMFSSPRAGITPISDPVPVTYNVNESPIADLKSQIDKCFTRPDQNDCIIKLYICWRCSARKFKCPAHVYLYANNELRVGAKPHNHDASVPVVEKNFGLYFHANFFRYSFK